MTRRDVPWWKISGAAAVMVAVGVVAWIIDSGTIVPNEIQPISWHKQSCAHCQMLIAEPLYAAQLITERGEVLSFDDPGCAMRYLDDHQPQIHRLWFHHGRDPRWLAVEQVGFVANGTTPMGYGLVAVDRDSPGAIDWMAARSFVSAHSVGASAEVQR